MTKFSLPFTKLVHENLSILMTFCYSRKPLQQLLNKKFKGEWKYLRKGILDVSEQRAERACLELAFILRMLDDEQDLTQYLREGSKLTFGHLFIDSETKRNLEMRDVCNKIIHSVSLVWDFTSEDVPILICKSRNSEKWDRAEVDIISLAAFCGTLIH